MTGETIRPTAVTPAQFPWADYSGQTFSLGLLVGSDLILSGHSGAVFDAEAGRSVVRGGMGDQAQIAYDKQAASLGAAGMAFADVTRVVENVTIAGLDSYAEARAVRDRVFGTHRPTVVTVVVDRLVRRTALIEVELHASAGGGDVLVEASSASDATASSVADISARRELVRRGHDGTVYLPTLLPVDDQGGLVAPGDPVGQYTYCLERGLHLLERAGLGASNIVSTAEYLSEDSRADPHAGSRSRAALLDGVRPAVTSVLMSRLHAPGVLVALDVVASTEHPVPVEPGWASLADDTASHAVRAGGTLFVSAVSSRERGSGQPSNPGDLRAQAEQVYADVLDTLAAVGSSAPDLLSTVEYVTAAGIGDYRAVADVRRAMLAPPFPASTGIVCGGLLAGEAMFQVVPTAFVAADHAAARGER